MQDALLEAAVEGIISIDEWGIVQSFNRGAEQLFGYKKHEVIGQNVCMLMTSAHGNQHDSYLQNLKGGGKAKIIGIGRDVPAQRKDGSVFPMHLSVGESRSEHARLFVGVCHDLSEFKAVLQRLISAEPRYRDIVENQKEFICRLSKNSRLTFVNNAFCRQLNQPLFQVLGISIFKFIHADERYHVESLLDQLRQAESAMFEAKQQALPLRMYHEDIHNALTRQLEIEQGLRRALEQDLLSVVLQPKYHLLSKELMGYEALVRWHDTELGFIAPNIFVAVAEAVNLGKKLDCWVIKTVLQQIKLWRQAGLQSQPVAVNITAKHFSDPVLHSYVITKLQLMELPAECLQLEITEGVAMDNSPAILENLNAFRNAGIKVAIDDFGTG